MLHVAKLAMVSSVSRTNEIEYIDQLDARRAIDWLIEAEKLMPDIFRSMIGRSDHEVIEELHLHMHSLYAQNKNKPIQGHQLQMFLLKRVPSDKIRQILEAAENSNMISRVGITDTWIPKNRTEFSE
jgi:hypothetical protein